MGQIADLYQSFRNFCENIRRKSSMPLSSSQRGSLLPCCPSVIVYL
jgi:hypothetical protein